MPHKRNLGAIFLISYTTVHQYNINTNTTRLLLQLNSPFQTAFYFIHSSQYFHFFHTSQFKVLYYHLPNAPSLIEPSLTSLHYTTFYYTLMLPVACSFVNVLCCKYPSRFPSINDRQLHSCIPTWICFSRLRRSTTLSIFSAKLLKYGRAEQLLCKG